MKKLISIITVILFIVLMLPITASATEHRADLNGDGNERIGI